MDPFDGTVAIAVTGEYAVSGVVQDPLARVIWRVGAPAVASNLLMIVFASADAFWVGTRLGSAALAAVATSLFWIWLFISIAEMVSVGLTAVASRRHGERRHEEAAHVVGDALIFALFVGSAIALGGTVWLPQLLSAMHIPPAVSTLGAAYLGTYLLGMPLIFVYFAVDAAFRASGDTRTPLALLATSVVVTLALDPALILGKAGLPRLGITGAAVATIATRGGASILGRRRLLARRDMVRFRRPRLASLLSIMRVGMPTAITGVLFSVIYVAVTRTVTRFGTPALAAMGLGFRIESWFYMVGAGFGAAAAAIVGQNLGARQAARASRAGWLTLAYASAPAVVAVAVELLIPRQMASLFTGDIAVVTETAHYLRIAAVAQLFTASELVLEGALGGAGYTVAPMITSTSISASRIPLAQWASRWGTTGIWTVIATTAAGRGIGMMALWRAGRWKTRKV